MQHIYYGEWICTNQIAHIVFSFHKITAGISSAQQTDLFLQLAVKYHPFLSVEELH